MNMSGQKSKSTAPKPTAGATVSRTTTSDAIRPRRRMTQNYLVIWVDGNINENTEDCRNTLAQLRVVVSEVNVCRTPEGCTEFLNKMDDGKAFVISSGALGQSLVNDIHGMPKVDAIYIFCGNKERHEAWAKDWPKIRGFRNLLQKKEIPDTEINELKRKYHQKSPVWWYTCEMFLYGMLNRGLRSLDMEVMSKLGFFIRSLHLQLEQLHKEQSVNFQKPFTVYRGQGLGKEDFQNLLDSKGGLLSFNNFLSTSMEPKVGMEFVERALQKNQDIVGVIFIMKIDQSKISTSNTPFAMIDEHSAIRGEKEILFTMHTVFRVVEMKQTTTNSRLWEIQLTITDENDPQLSALTNRIKEEITGSGWYRMGKLMLQVGHLDQAEELYNELLESASTDSDRAFIYHQLGWLKDDQGKYPEAVKFYEKSLEIKRKTLPEDDASLAATYSVIGTVYYNMGDYSKALEFHEKAYKIYEKTLPPNHPNLATSYNEIGVVYNNMGEYSKALEYYERSLKIRVISLPENHPSLAASYNNIGAVYTNMGEYSKALEFHKKIPQNKRNISA
ncbi:unnamed protein product [Rotaria socialis]|uniref:Uncharacterized protein n=2 Tax=Rotaria socialis TaxID=392032 RepID=A0A821Q8P7_9BILA|nr:unnamed protein product [Rotaria socialis]